jgi:FkbM family methyltransferase
MVMDYSQLPWLELESEDHVAKMAIQYLPSNPVILEAGCCDGTDTLRFKYIWPESVVYAFEPNRDMVELVLPNKFNGIDGIHLECAALSDEEGERTFFFSRLFTSASSLLEDNIAGVAIPEDILANVEEERRNNITYDDEARLIQCYRVDTWARRNLVDRIDYVWLDAEGMELRILQSFGDLLQTVKVISAEVNFQEFRKGMAMFPGIYKFLTEHGFKLKNIWGRSDWQAGTLWINEKNNKGA